VDETLTDDEVVAEAELLDEAERTATQVRQTTEVHPDMTMADAYRVQAAWRDRKLARGETLVGHKIGLTSRAMQAAMRIDTPDSGFLTDAMVFEPGSSLVAGSFCDPKLEVELAFVLGSDLSGTDLTIDDVLDATDHVVPAVELIAARSYRTDPTTGRTRTVVDTIADNAADAGIVTGGRVVRPDAVDLRWVSALLYKNETIEESGVAAAVLNHPATGVAWLANKFHQHGARLEAGEVILAGSFTRPMWVERGDSVLCDYGRMGTIACRFI